MKNVIKLIGAMVLTAVSANAFAIPTLSDVGSYDTLVVSADLTYLNPYTLPNSGSGTEEAWIEAVLGFDIDYTQLSDSDSKGEPGSNNWLAVTDGVSGDYAFNLSPNNPDYFLVKVGNGNGTGVDYSHYLFKNLGSMDWAFVNLGVFGSGVTLTNIGVISHVGVTGSSNVPEPGLVGLLAMGLIGMVAARRRMKD